VQGFEIDGDAAAPCPEPLLPGAVLAKTFLRRPRRAPSKEDDIGFRPAN
jgi:hypothetical protein